MSSHRMNILLITSEDNGPQLSCYGDSNVHTPNLDRLAASGVRFENAYVTQAVCSPGRASILTGLYPHQHGQIGLATHRFSMFGPLPNIPTLLKQAGYRTGRIGKLHVLPESAFAFDWVWNPSERISFQHRDVHATAAAAGNFMGASDEPFFLMVNYSDAHLPWLDQSFDLPVDPLRADQVQPLPALGVDSPRLRAATASYYNCIRRLDTGIGLLLEQLEKTGQADRTLIVYITDHGPQFSRGKMCINELALRTPLLVRWPGVSSAGSVRAELVSQIDILPTVLEAAGVNAPAELAGKSLLPLMAGQAVPEFREHLFAQWNTSHPHPTPALLYPQRSVRDARFKLILNMLAGQPAPVDYYYTRSGRAPGGVLQEEIDSASPAVRSAYALWQNPPRYELYDLQNDPHEFQNLADDPANAATLDRLSRVLQQWQIETGDAMADADRLSRFMAEHERTTALEGAHRFPDFNWEYLDYLRPISPRLTTSD